MGNGGLYLSGFHLLNSSHGEIEKIAERLKNLGVQKISPTHCSGDLAREIMKEIWKENFLDLGAGATFTVP